MRTNDPGNPGKYTCDRCHQPSPRGVMTGCAPFEHVCLWCYGVWQKLPNRSALQKRTPLLGIADPWLAPTDAEIAERQVSSQNCKDAWEARSKV